MSLFTSAAYQKDRLWSLTFITVIIISFLSSTLSNGLNNALPVYVESIGGTATFSGHLTAVFSLAAGAGRFLGGNLSDRLGRKKPTAAGASLMLVGCAISMLNTSFEILLICRAIQGMGFAMATTATATAVADIAPASRVGEGIGYHSLGYAFALPIGVSCGVALVGWGSGLALFGGFAMVSAIALAFALSLRLGAKSSTQNANQQALDADESQARLQKQVKCAPQKEQFLQKDKRRRLSLIWALFEQKAIPVALIQFTYTFGTVIFTCFSALYAIRYGIENVGLFFITMAVGVILIRLMTVRYLDRISAAVFLVPSFFLAIASCALMLAFHTDIAYTCAGFLYGLSGGLSMPAVSSEVVRRSPKSRIGAGNATFWLSMDIGMTLGTLLWGFVIDIFGFNATLAASMAVLAVGILLIFTVLRLTDPARNKPEKVQFL
jgi:MFS family permease